MRAKHAAFVVSAPTVQTFPAPDHPEIAFAGRSNVGKSSLINALCGVARLAKTSATPGHTRLLNWFHVVPPGGGDLAFVDLPGYGYAKVARSARNAWGPVVERYLRERDGLCLTLLLIDIRRGPEPEEHEVIDFLRAHERACLVVLTKADKLPKARRHLAQVTIQKELGVPKAPLLFSAKTGDGQRELWQALLRVAGTRPRARK